jgi:N-acetylmuramoyl-L-alanine amidase
MLPTSFRLTYLKSLAAVVVALAFCGAEARAQSRTIIVDAGHGGIDRGGVPGQRISEKEMTLDVSQRLRRILEASGYRVIMTRNSDVFVPLGQRTAIANSYRGATFVSVHFNSARRAGANGIETYYYRGDSAGLAANIHRNVVAIAPTENRGIRRRGYFVLRRTSIPGVLVECGFLTNPYEGRTILNAAYRQRLAEAIARGIRRQPAGYNKPLNPGSRASAEALPQAIAGPDFVRAAPRPRYRRTSRYHRSSRASRSRSRSTRQKSSRSKRTKKKRSSDNIQFIRTNAAFV